MSPWTSQDERNEINAREVAIAFVAAINQHDVEAICRLMTEDHTLIDPGGDVYSGADQMRQVWAGYFKMFPDYVIEVSEVFISDDTVVLLGKASGTYTSDGKLMTENHWEMPAAWKAVAVSEKVKVWQVFADNEPVRRIIEASTGE